MRPDFTSSSPINRRWRSTGGCKSTTPGPPSSSPARKNIDLDVFVCWSVKQPQRFLETVGDLAGANSRIHDMVWSKLAAEVSSHPLETLVSVDGKASGLLHPSPGDTRSGMSGASEPSKAMIERVARHCARRPRKNTALSWSICGSSGSVCPSRSGKASSRRMRKERARIAQRYRSEGTEEATKIRAAADKEKTVILAGAFAEAEIIRGKAEATATRTYAEAHQKDPQFYELMRTLEVYKKIFDEKTTILLSGDSELLKYLSHGPPNSSVSMIEPTMNAATRPGRTAAPRRGPPRARSARKPAADRISGKARLDQPVAYELAPFARPDRGARATRRGAVGAPAGSTRRGRLAWAVPSSLGRSTRSRSAGRQRRSRSAMPVARARASQLAP